MTNEQLDELVALAHEEKPTCPAPSSAFSEGGWWRGGNIDHQPWTEWVVGRSATADPAVAAGLRAEINADGWGYLLQATCCEAYIPTEHPDYQEGFVDDPPTKVQGVCGHGDTEELATALCYLEWHRSRQEVPQGTESEVMPSEP